MTDTIDSSSLLPFLMLVQILGCPFLILSLTKGTLYTASSLELVFLVLVRYAYGFLDFHVHIQSALTMPLRSTPITGASSLLRAAAPWICRPFPACAAKVSLHLLPCESAVHGSLVPYFSFTYRF